MKAKKIFSFAIRVLYYAIALCCCLVIIGSVGAHENGAIEALRMWSQIGLGVIGLVASVVLYVVRDWFNHYFIKLPAIRANRVR